MSSSNKIFARVPIALKVDGQPHVDLANRATNVESWKWFQDIPAKYAQLFESSLPGLQEPPLFTAEEVKKLTGLPKGQGWLVGLRDSLRKAWRGDKQTIDGMRQVLARAVHAGLQYRDGHFEIVLADFEIVLVGLFLLDYDAGRAGICENPECRKPFFVKRRSTQVLCQRAECITWKKKEEANAWWRKHGNVWRSKQKRKKR